jgi:hypothetical protein
MATTTPVDLYASASIPTTKTTVVAAAANTKRINRRVTFINDNASAVTVDLYITPDGSNEIHIVHTKIIAPYETYSPPDIEGHVLEAAGTMAIAGSTTSIECIISGFNVT